MDISVLDKQRIMVIIRHKTSFDIRGLSAAVLETGLKVMEITLNTPGAYELIKTSSKNFESDMLIGAGTVLTIEEIKKAVDNGARFIVSPVTDIDMIEYCVKNDVTVFPGAFTPTEIYTAYKSGAYMVKVFPSSVVGYKYFKSLKAPLSNLRLMAVGGVNPDNINDYLTNGADAVAVGAGTVKPEWVENMNYQCIKDNIRKLLNAAALN